MRVTELLQEFQGMAACDRLHLLCQMMRCCLPQELHFIRTILLGLSEENNEKISKQELVVNQLSYVSGLQNGGILADKNLAKLCCGMALMQPHNRAMAQECYKMLNDQDLLESVKSCEDIQLLEELRLLYVIAVYHPALNYTHQRDLMVTLEKLDSLYEQLMAKREEQEKTAETVVLASESDLSAEPSDDAYVLSCEVKGVYKRQGDKRHPYVIKVNWSDGAVCHVQRTYGDFFSFQNKLLDLFPEESGQRNKKQRVIPFLPGRRLLSGKTNRELAEKRLPDIYQYTRALIALPVRISLCKHVVDFFRPRPTDVKFEDLPLRKMKTLQDVKVDGKGRHASLLANGVPSPSQSPSISQSGIGRSSHTLPLQINQKSEPKEGESPLARRFTYPARPSAFTPVVASHAVHSKISSSQNSLSSGERQSGTLTTTTTACMVVTPPSKRTSGSPAFSVSGVAGNRVVWNSSKQRSSIASESPDVALKQGRQADISSQSSNSLHSLDSPTIHPNSKMDSPAKQKTEPKTRNWADRCSPPPESSTDEYPSSFIPISSSALSQVTSTATAESKPARTSTITCTTASSTPTTVTTAPSSARVAGVAAARTTILSPSPTSFVPSVSRGIPFSPSLPQLYGNIPAYYPICSFSPFSSSPISSPIPSPKRHLPLRTSHTPTSTYTVSEFEHFSKWLKSHRLHKYSPLFLNMNFEEVCKLTAEQLKDLGMTQGAAKKLYQKLEELRMSCVASFRDIPITAISRKPSTSSLPAALVNDPKLTPSSSIDQLSLHSSTCSLDVIGQAHSHTPISTRLSGDGSAVIMNVDSAILEAGRSLSNDSNSEDGHGDTGTLKYGIEANNSHSSLSSAQSGLAGSRGKLNGLHSQCSCESSSPRASLSGDAIPIDGGPLSAGGPHRERVSSMPEKRCASLSPTQRLFSTPQPSHTEVQQQFHQHRPINALWEVQLRLQQQQQVAMVMASRQQHGLGYLGSAPGWSAQQAVIRPPAVLTNSFRGGAGIRMPPQYVTHSPYTPNNGMMRISSSVDPIHLSVAHPTLAPQNPMSIPVNRTTPPHLVTCCNCAKQDHTVISCPFTSSHSHIDHTAPGTHSYRETVK